MEKSATGISLLGVLGIVFIVLKLCKVINWSWWLVTMPLWIGAAATLLLLIMALAVVIIAFFK